MAIVMADYGTVPPAGEELKATFTKIDEGVRLSNKEEGVRFVFNLTDHPGWSATALCTGVPTQNNRFGRVLAGLLGQMPGPKENVDEKLAGCIGNNYNIVIKHNEMDDGRVYLNVDTIEKK